MVTLGGLKLEAKWMLENEDWRETESGEAIELTLNEWD